MKLQIINLLFIVSFLKKIS